MSAPAAPTIPEEVLEIARVLEAAGYEAWCVGGALRDALLDHPHSDYDFATSATPEQVQALFRRTASVGAKYGTVGVIDRHRVLHEVTTFRRDVTTDGRHAVVAYGVSLEDDLARRDFTINAIAYHPLRHEWRDPFGGRVDLARGVLRAVGAPAERFREDYLRILRGIRFAARFGFEIESATWAAAVEAAPAWRSSRPSGCAMSGSRAYVPRGPWPSWSSSGSARGRPSAGFPSWARRPVRDWRAREGRRSSGATRCYSPRC